MTGPTREGVLQWARSIEGVRVFDMGGSIFGKPEYLERFAALAFAAGSRSGDDALDAARYRWLRDKSAEHTVPAPTATLQSGRGIKVVYQAYGGDDRVKPRCVLFDVALDAAIDAAMGGK